MTMVTGKSVMQLLQREDQNPTICYAEKQKQRLTWRISSEDQILVL